MPSDDVFLDVEFRGLEFEQIFFDSSASRDSRVKDGFWDVEFRVRTSEDMLSLDSSASRDSGLMASSFDHVETDSCKDGSVHSELMAANLVKSLHTKTPAS